LNLECASKLVCRARLRGLAWLAGLLFIAVPLAALAEEQLVVISNGEVVGTLDVSREGDLVQVVYRVDNNGRGPKVEEQLKLDGRGYPLDWSIEGTSLFGAAVDEHYRWSDGRSEWSSQADRGTAAAEHPPMYIGGDSSPWSYGMYVRALLQDDDRAIDVLPSGRMTLKQLETLEIGENDRPVTVYEVSGIQLEPQLIALEDNGALFARFGGSGGLVRRGNEAALEQLNEWSRDYELRRLHALQQKLAHRYPAPIVYRNVRVFDPRAAVTGPPVAVRVRDGRIDGIETDPMAGNPDQEAIVDGAGGTLVAGLHDMHSHSSMDNGLYYLAAGVTSTRDMGNDNDLLPEIRRAIAAGELAGPNITPDGMIEARSPYSVRLGIVADTLEDALEAVRWYDDHGYYEIKIYNSMKPEWLQPLAAEARRLGLGVTGHVPAFVTPDEAIRAGYNSIAHINQLMLGWLLEPGEDTRTPLRLTGMKRAASLDLNDPRVQMTVALMREHGTALDTTAVILERLMLSRAGEVNPGDRPYLSHMPIGYQRYRKRTFVPLNEPGDDAAYRTAFDKLEAVIKLLYDNGIALLPGTDDGTGFTVHRELELYVNAGIPAPKVLAMATLGSARYLGQEDEQGSIEPGKRADFILLSGDPARDISALRSIRLVSRGGAVYFPSEIYPELGIQPFASGVTVAVPGGVAP
jgi:imidazolonepropionase-like amidohydrolase